MKKSNLIGKKAYIEDPESIYCGEWGIIKAFDGDQYYIAIAGDENSIPVFIRSQFHIYRKEDR